MHSYQPRSFWRSLINFIKIRVYNFSIIYMPYEKKCYKPKKKKKNNKTKKNDVI